MVSINRILCPIDFSDFSAADYWFGPVVGVDPAERARNTRRRGSSASACSTGFRRRRRAPTGASAIPGLRLRGDVVGRHARRAGASAVRPGVEAAARRVHGARAAHRASAEAGRAGAVRRLGRDRRATGSISIPRVSGAGYLDLGCWPFQIPLGAMIPVRVENLLPGGKNLGVTHITNGAFRAASGRMERRRGRPGSLAAFCLERNDSPEGRAENRPELLEEFQALLRREGIELSWPSLHPCEESWTSETRTAHRRSRARTAA